MGLPRKREGRVTRCALAAVAALGVVLIVDGLGAGATIHRAFAVVSGAVLVLPLALCFLLGPWWMRAVRGLGVSLLTLAVLGTLAELALRRWADGGFRAPEVRRDPVLGHAFVPDKGGYDAWGFRNPSAPGSAEVVVLGDSQTYGTNVATSESYPAVLGRLAGVRAYNMGIGGYGPLQYLALLERALELRPRTVVVGLYLGNDVVDASRYAGLEAWAELRDPAVRYPASPGEQPRDFQEQGAAPNLAVALLQGAVERSLLAWRLTHAVKTRLRTTRALADLYWREPGAPVLDDGPLRTHFTPAVRRPLVDARNPAVRDGLRILDVCLERMARRCAGTGVELVLLPIPTKETCYALHLQEGGEDADLVRQLAPVARREGALREDVLALAERHGVRVVDPLPEMLEALGRGQPLWPAYSDGHLDASGCALVAEVLCRELEAVSERGSSPRR